MMRPFQRAVTCVAALAVATGQAQGDLVAFRFTGTISQSSDQGVDVGDPFTATYTFDDTALPVDPLFTGGLASYDQPPGWGITFDINGANYFASENPGFGPGHDGLRIQLGDDNAPGNGAGDSYVAFAGWQSSTQPYLEVRCGSPTSSDAITSLAVPSALDLSDWGYAAISVTPSGAPLPSITGDIVTFQATSVPEASPFIAWIGFGACFCWGCHRWSKS